MLDKAYIDLLGYAISSNSNACRNSYENLSYRSHVSSELKIESERIPIATVYSTSNMLHNVFLFCCGVDVPSHLPWWQAAERQDVLHLWHGLKFRL